MLKMLKVFVSNSYQALFKKFDEALSNTHNQKPFQYITLVSGTKFIADKLKRDISSQKGICSGIQFQSQQVWQARTMGTARQSGAEALSLVWAIWQILSDNRFVDQHSCLKHFICHSDSLGKFQLAQRIADTFSDYLRYRPEWMSAWLVGEDPVGLKDSIWQMSLWQKVNEIDPGLGTFLKTDTYEENLRRMPSPLHFFIPTSLQPTGIQALKDAANRYEKDITVYFFSPFGKNEGKQSSFIDKYATRAQEVINLFDPQTITYLTTGSDTAKTLLTNIQTALWDGTIDNLPSSFDPKDNSIRIVSTVSHTREVENAVDLIHYWTKQGVKADEILVVTPDIKSLTPTIHSVLGSLPNDKSISYRIIGEPSASATLVSSAFLELGKLLGGRCTIDEFADWLELPAVAQSFSLSLNDMAVIKDWLVTAGFMFGLNDEHLNRQSISTESTKDATLARAIERLALGLITDDTIELVGDTLPVRNGKSFKFQTVESQGILLTALFKIYALLNDLLSVMPKTEVNPRYWDQFAYKLLDVLFAKGKFKDEAVLIQTTLRNLLRSFASLDPQPVLPFNVYWKALESILTQPSQGTGNDGRVTFANMGTMRGIPYKVIIALGLDADSGFPGEQSYHEFHLMGKVKPMPGDANKCMDSQSIFADMLSSAQDALILSFAGDRNKDRLSPSSVVEDLAAFANTKTGASPSQWMKSLESVIGRSRMSITNFSKEDSHNRYWMTGNDKALKALQSLLNDPRPEPHLIDGGIKTEPNGLLTFRELINFFKDPGIWAEKKLGLKVIEEDVGDAPEFLGEQDYLSKHLFFADNFRRLQKGWSKNEIERFISSDPTNGVKSLRLANRKDDLSEVLKAYEFYCTIKDLLYSDSLDVLQFTKPVKLHHFNTFQVDCSDFFKLKEMTEDKEVYELFVLCRSDDAILRTRLLQCALGFVGQPVNALIVHPSNKKCSEIPLSLKNINTDTWTASSCPCPDCAEEVMGMLIKTYEAALRDVTTLSTKDKSFLGDSLPAKLWRGRDWSASVKKRNDWENCIKNMIKEADKRVKESLKKGEK